MFIKSYLHFFTQSCFTAQLYRQLCFTAEQVATGVEVTNSTPGTIASHTSNQQNVCDDLSGGKYWKCRRSQIQGENIKARTLAKEKRRRMKK